MNAAIIALRLLVLFTVIGCVVTYTPPGRAFTDLLAALIGGTDNEGHNHG